MSHTPDAAAPAAPLPLAYGPPARPVSRVTARGVALACGGVPLVAGLPIFAAWLLTGREDLIGAGLITIGGGVLLSAIGAAALLVHVGRGLRGTHVPRRRTLRDGVLLGLLLLANYPATFLCAATALEIQFRYLVTVVNSSAAPVESFVLSGAVVPVQVGPIPAGVRVRQVCRFTGDGELTFTATQGSVSYTGPIDNYVSRSLGRDALVTINGPGAVTVTDRKRPPWRKWIDSR
jgi:hypothetical protein